MNSDLHPEQGELLVRLARAAVEELVRTGGRREPPTPSPPGFLEKKGVFVTIYKLVNGVKQLRGCIGIPFPEKSLVLAVIDSACDAASEDPRFPPVSKDEFDSIIIEVSILTTPALIQVSSPLEYPGMVKVGEHGLIVKWSLGSGLLLPQVPVEQNWNSTEFLSEACMKAGTTPDLWLARETKIYRFSAQVFAEASPRGKVVHVELRQGAGFEA